MVSRCSSEKGGKKGNNLPNPPFLSKIRVLTYLQGLHELPGSRSCNCSQVVDQVGFSHSNTSVLNGNRVVIFVGDDSDFEFLFCLQYRRVSETLVPDLVQGLQIQGEKKIKTLTI